MNVTQFPMLHLNGSHASHLLDPMADAVNKLLDARDALHMCAPHGRDYYTISSTAIDIAMAEHIARLKRIDSTIAELQAIMGNVLEQSDERDERRSR
jgi:hypothetical protein